MSLPPEPGTSVTSSQPSCPKLLRICAATWLRTGATWYSHLVMPRRLTGRELCHDAPVSLDNAVWLLTGLAAVVVLLTRMRLSSEQSQSGHAVVPLSVVNAHTLVGVAALAVWIYYLTSPDGMWGLAGLGLWWIEVGLGLLILARWMSRPSKHAADTTGDSWAEG